MPVSVNGRKMIESFEGLRFTAYQDGNGIWTCGHGHTAGVTADTTCTQDQADAWLAQDLFTAQNCITHLVKVTINQNQYDALVSFAYNIGCGNFAKSTVLDRLNMGNIEAASQGFMMWTKVNGNISMGLVRRRDAERALFLQEPE